MSEEKLYAVKNDEGLLLLYSEQGAPLWRVWGEMFADKPAAERAANAENGHIVALVEEPEKVVLTKEQAEIVERAHGDTWPAKYITDNTDDEYYSERILMEAFVNGYTVAKEKKYLVYKELGGKQKHEQFAQAYRSSIYHGTISWILTNEVKSGSWAQFTEAEIEHYGLQDCEKEEVTDDEQ